MPLFDFPARQQAGKAWLSGMNKKLFLAFFALFVVGIIVSVPMRIVELLRYIDPSTGFYSGGETLVTALNVFLFIITLLMLIPLLFKSDEMQKTFVRKSQAAAVICFVAALCFFGACLAKMGQLILTSSPGEFFIALSELLAGIFFILLGMKRSGSSLNLAAPALFPVFWGIIILIVSFMQYTAIANISKSLFDVMKMVFMLVFLYYNAMAVGEIPNNRGINGLMAFGLPAAFFSILTTVPKAVAYLIKANSGSAPSLNDALYFLLSIYVLYVLVEAYLFRYVIPKRQEFHETLEEQPEP